MVSVYLYHRQEEADNSAASSISCGRPSSQCKCIAQNNVSVSVSSIARRSSISVCARFRGQPGPHHVSVCLLASGHQDSCKAQKLLQLSQAWKQFLDFKLIVNKKLLQHGWDQQCGEAVIKIAVKHQFKRKRLLPECSSPWPGLLTDL